MALDHNVVKTWFVSRAKPLADQFAKWIDACWFKGEKIPIGDIDGIDTYFAAFAAPVILNQVADFSYMIPAGYSVYQLYITSTNDATLHLGTAVGLDDIAADFDVVAGAPTPVSVVIPAQVATEVFFTGVNSATRVVIYLHKL